MSVKIRLLMGICLIFMLTTLPIKAQNNVTPLNIGENKPGEIATSGATPSYTISIDTPNFVVVQVLALTQFTPSFRVISPFGIELINAEANENESIVQANVALPAVGDYMIEVLGGNAGAGYVISVQQGELLPPPIALTLGERIIGEVTVPAPVKQYSFSAAADQVLFVSVESLSQTHSPVIALRENATSELIALSNAALIGVTYRIPTGANGYVLDILQGGAEISARYSICIESLEVRCAPIEQEIPPEATDEPQESQENIEITQTLAPIEIVATEIPANSCRVASAVGVLINVRALPALNSDILAQLAVNTSAPVIGRSSDNIWWLIDINGIPGWVSTAVTSTVGACDSVQILFPNE